MKKVLLVSALSLMISVGVQAQRVDSLRMDSIIHNLPDVIVKGERPIAKVNGSTVTYGLPLLLKKRAVDNMYDAIKEIPGVIEQDKKLSLGGMPTTVILDGKVTSMTVDEVTSLLKSMPANRIAKVDVMYNAPAKMQVRGALINIRLRHSHIDGISPSQGEINLAWKQQHDAEFGERTSLLYYKGKFSLDLMYQHSHGDS
ncbi:MAG: signal protein, partial [Prevotella sp.]|nr:signal protein [Prevotella sp.]